MDQLHPNLDSEGGKVLSPHRVIAQVETLLLEPDSSWICDQPKTSDESGLQKICGLRGHSDATTRSVITTPSLEDFSGFRFLCCSPQVIPMKNGGKPDGRHHFQEIPLLMADVEAVF